MRQIWNSEFPGIFLKSLKIFEPKLKTFKGSVVFEFTAIKKGKNV